MTVRTLVAFALGLSLFLGCENKKVSNESAQAVEKESVKTDDTKPTAKQEGSASKEDGKAVGADSPASGKNEPTENSEASLELSDEEISKEIPAVGHEFCDGYIKKYQACLLKGPKGERSKAYRRLVEQAGVWKSMAADPASKEALEIGCRGADSVAKQGSADWGCEW